MMRSEETAIFKESPREISWRAQQLDLDDEILTEAELLKTTMGKAINDIQSMSDVLDSSFTTNDERVPRMPTKKTSSTAI